MSAQAFDITVPNQLSSINVVNQRFNEFTSAYRISTEVRRQINVVIDELLNNVISYGFEDDEAHDIELRVALAGSRLVIELIDDGLPFNPFTYDSPDTTLPLESRRVGGLGIHLVRQTMDEASYERRIGKNVVRLTKLVEITSNGQTTMGEPGS